MSCTPAPRPAAASSPILLLLIALALALAPAAAQMPPSRCANDCSEHGKCVEGVCLCDAAWAGRDCSERVELELPTAFPGLDAVLGPDSEKARARPAPVFPPLLAPTAATAATWFGTGCRHRLPGS